MKNKEKNQVANGGQSNMHFGSNHSLDVRNIKVGRVKNYGNGSKSNCVVNDEVESQWLHLWNASLFYHTGVGSPKLKSYSLRSVKSLGAIDHHTAKELDVANGNTSNGLRRSYSGTSRKKRFLGSNILAALTWNGSNSGHLKSMEPLDRLETECDDGGRSKRFTLSLLRKRHKSYSSTSSLDTVKSGKKGKTIGTKSSGSLRGMRKLGKSLPNVTSGKNSSKVHSETFKVIDCDEVHFGVSECRDGGNGVSGPSTSDVKRTKSFVAPQVIRRSFRAAKKLLRPKISWTPPPNPKKVKGTDGHDMMPEDGDRGEGMLGQDGSSSSVTPERSSPSPIGVILEGQPSSEATMESSSSSTPSAGSLSKNKKRPLSFLKSIGKKVGKRRRSRDNEDMFVRNEEADRDIVHPVITQTESGPPEVPERILRLDKEPKVLRAKKINEKESDVIKEKPVSEKPGRKISVEKVHVSQTAVDTGSKESSSKGVLRTVSNDISRKISKKTIVKMSGVRKERSEVLSSNIGESKRDQKGFQDSVMENFTYVTRNGVLESEICFEDEKSSGIIDEKMNGDEDVQDNRKHKRRIVSANEEDFELSNASDTMPFNDDSSSVISFEPQSKRERLYKVLVVGELGTGKTSLIKRYVHQFFSQHYRATIGVDFALKVLRWDPNTVIRLQLWDIAGQERFGSMTRVYYKEAVGAIVVFDVTRTATLEAVSKWKQDLDAKVVLPNGKPVPCILVASKCDQPKEGMVSNPEKMRAFCQQQGFIDWFETSARDDINIDEAMNFLVCKILEVDEWSQEPIKEDPDKIDIAADGKAVPNSDSCSC